MIWTGYYGIAYPSYELNKQELVVGFPARARCISLLQGFQSATGTHPASYSRGTKSAFFRWKAAETWTKPLTSIQGWGNKCFEIYIYIYIYPIPCITSWLAQDQLCLVTLPHNTYKPLWAQSLVAFYLWPSHFGCLKMTCIFPREMLTVQRIKFVAVTTKLYLENRVYVSKKGLFLPRTVQS